MRRSGGSRHAAAVAALPTALLIALLAGGCTADATPPGPTEPTGVPTGPQPTSGPGWRLLGERDQVGEAYRTGVATTDAQLTALWAESALPGEAPVVDWQREIAVWFGDVHGSSCPIRLDAVVVDGTTVHATTVIPGSGPMHSCTADAIPHSYVVAVQRSLLPDEGFTVQLTATDPPSGAMSERTRVDVSLRAPGSSATDAELDPAPGTR